VGDADAELAAHVVAPRGELSVGQERISDVCTRKDALDTGA
jgi:hypothetical protein